VSLTNSLNKFNARSLTNKSVKNHKGVDCFGLLDIDPQQIIVPILHCPMGLVDKVLETFKSWVVYEVEQLPVLTEIVRQTLRTAKADHISLVVAEEQARLAELSTGTAEAAALFRIAKLATKRGKAEQRRRSMK